MAPPDQVTGRRSTRVRVDDTPFLLYPSENSTWPALCHAVEVNAHGGLLKCRQALQPGSTVRLERFDSSATATATVRRCAAIPGSNSQWLVGVELAESSNFWAFPEPPSDWELVDDVPADIQEAEPISHVQDLTADVAIPTPAPPPPTTLMNGSNGHESSAPPVPRTVAASADAVRQARAAQAAATAPAKSPLPKPSPPVAPAMQTPGASINVRGVAESLCAELKSTATAATDDIEDLAISLQQRFRSSHERAQRKLQMQADEYIQRFSQIETRIAERATNVDALLEESARRAIDTAMQRFEAQIASSVDAHCRAELERLSAHIQVTTSSVFRELAEGVELLRSSLDDARNETSERTQALESVLQRASELQQSLEGREQGVRTALEQGTAAALAKVSDTADRNSAALVGQSQAVLNAIAERSQSELQRVVSESEKTGSAVHERLAARVKDELQQLTIQSQQLTATAKDEISSVVENGGRQIHEHVAAELERAQQRHADLLGSMTDIKRAALEEVSTQAAARIQEAVDERLKNFQAECDRTVTDALAKWRTTMAQALGVLPQGAGPGTHG